MAWRTILMAVVMLVCSGAAWAVPRFEGLKEARPAPGAAVLRWERSPDDNKRGSVHYNVYQSIGGEWNFRRPAARVEGNEWVITGLPPGREVSFIVRAASSRGEEQNRRAVSVRPTGALPSAEWRGVWWTRFEWANGGRAAIEQRIREGMQALGRGNFNAVVFQVRGQGDTLYPSEHEPWSPMLRGDARSFDPVALAIEEARRNGLQFHAYMNLSVIWQSGAKRPPEDRNHPFYRFADASNPGRRLGLIHDERGRPRQWGADDYVWLTHGNPEVNAYLRRQVMAFLRKYRVDGLHWDDRTGNPNGVSRDPVSVRRFEGRGNPHRIRDFEQWQRDQLTRFLSDLYVEIKAHDPSLLVSVSPFGIADRRRVPGYDRFNDAVGFGVEPEKWLRLGVVDVLMPQIYWDLPDPEPNYGTLARDWRNNNRSGRPIWPGSALGKYGRDVQPLDSMQVRYVAIQRALGMGGNTFFSYSAAQPREWANAARTLYPTPARVPVPSHMSNPREGHVAGRVTGPDGRPIVDGWIRLEGRDRIYLSGADGFFAIPNVPAGDHTLHAQIGGGQSTRQRISVRPGRVTPASFRFGANSP